VPHVPPPLIGLSAALAQHRLASGRPPGPVRKVGAAVAAMGSAWMLVGSLDRFRRTGTTVNPLDPARASTLVTSGPNAVTRNPMYVGMAGVLTAHALIRGGWRTLVPVAAFVAVIDRVQIRPEEAALRDLFGEEYDTYRRRVRRWL
jgi:protein-S-isoprenylcysteine O-methyltransferase Ste14